MIPVTTVISVPLYEQFFSQYDLYVRKEPINHNFLFLQVNAVFNFWAKSQVHPEKVPLTGKTTERGAGNV